MSDSTLKTRIINKHDSDEAWADASNKGFVPKKGEFIIYDSDGTLPERLKIGDGKHTPDNLPPSMVVPMSVVDAQRKKVYEDRGDYYFSEKNWDTFIGNNGQYGYNRVYVDRSQGRGQYSMYALNESADVIYNSWYSMSDWDQRFTQEHPGEDFREPNYDEYPKLDSIAQRDENGYLFVPLNPTHKKHAVSLDYVDQLLDRLKALEADLYSGTDGLSYELSSNGTYYICTGLGDVPQNERIEIAAYIDGLPVQEIGERAFKTVKLDSVTIPRTLNKIRAYAFNNATDSIGSLHIKDIAKWANIEFDSWGASPATAEGTKIYINGRYKTELIIPEGLSSIYPRAFAQFKQFTSVKLPESLTYIGQYSFQDCTGLSEVEIPANVVTVINSCFQNCTNLKSVLFKGTPSKVEAAFSGCTALTTIYAPWGENDVAGAPWGAPSATVYYYLEDKPTKPGNFWHYVEGIPTVWSPYRDTLDVNMNLDAYSSPTEIPEEITEWVQDGGQISMIYDESSGSQQLTLTISDRTKQGLVLKNTHGYELTTPAVSEEYGNTLVYNSGNQVQFLAQAEYGFDERITELFNGTQWYYYQPQAGGDPIKIYGTGFADLLDQVRYYTIYFDADQLSYGSYQTRINYTYVYDNHFELSIYGDDDLDTNLNDVQVKDIATGNIYHLGDIQASYLGSYGSINEDKSEIERDQVIDWLDYFSSDPFMLFIFNSLINQNIDLETNSIDISDYFEISHM